MDNNKKLLELVEEKIKEFEQKLENWKEDVRLDGKKIEVAIVEQPSLLAYYDQIASEAEYYMEVVDLHVKKIRAERMVYIKENYSREYTDSAIQKVIEGDKNYQSAYLIYLSMKSVYDKAKSIVEAFKQRSYSLNNLVKIYENEISDITIR